MMKLSRYFFRRSMFVLLSLGLLSAVAFFALKPKQVIKEEVATVSIAPQAEQRNSEPTPPAALFVDVTDSAGITFVHNSGAYGEKLLPETMGGGVALFDYDNDDQIDILFVNSSSWPGQPQQQVSGHRLYHNKGDWQFEDVTQQVGLNDTFLRHGCCDR